MFESVIEPRRANWKLRFAFAVVVIALGLALTSLLRMIVMPLRSYVGSLTALTRDELEIQTRLTSHVKYLSETIGERNLSRTGSLPATIEYLRNSLQQSGYTVVEQRYSVGNQ